MKKWGNKLNRAFSKEEVQMAKKQKTKKHMKICSLSPATKENQNHIKIPPHSCWNGSHQEHK
jgi:hypothetical protein